MKKIALFLVSLLVCLTVVFCVSNSRIALFYPSLSQRAAGQYTIILDPGHGGFDGGATSIHGTAEKEFNLEIALKLRNYLQLFGFNVIMTRTEDVGTDGLPNGSIRERKVCDIRNRMALVNSTEDCLLVSIHQNYFQDSSCCGTQVFYSKNLPQSKMIAQCVQRHIASELQQNNTRMVKSAGNEIYLLNNAQRPAVLIECGFISNVNDTELLSDETYQKKLSFCIAEALFDYMYSPEE